MRNSEILAAISGLCLIVAGCGNESGGRDNVAVQENGDRQTDAARQETGATAVFDWFEYSGSDEVYQTVSAGENEYLNPILSGFYPDPSIEQVGGDYYIVNSTFSYFPGMAVFHSRDLVNWTQIGNVIDRPSQLDFANLGMSRGIFAPAISYNDGVFYVATTCVDCGGNFVVTAEDPAGPWSDPVWLPGMGGIDPSLFFDDDGRAYFVNNDAPIGEPLYDGHRALWVQEFDVEEMKLIGPRELIIDGGVDISEQPIWIEGPHFYRVDGQLYLIAAEGGTSLNHSQVVWKGESVFGPFTPYENNPILTQRHLDPDRPFPVTSVGHADFVTDDEGNWWTIFLGVRPYEGNYYNTGRETFLMPVRWVDGWPEITQDDELVPYVHQRPALPLQEPGPYPMNGDFTIREEFDGAGLSPYWLFVRQPKEDDWHDLSAEPGSLTIKARPISLGAFDRPSFIARRQQHLSASASTAMRYQPGQAGDLAGMAAFQSDEFYYFLGLALNDDGETEIQVRRRAGPDDDEHGVVIASETLTLEAGAPLFLKIEGTNDSYDFLYGNVEGQWTPLLENADGKLLSTERAGGFIGAVFGMYAYRSEG